MPRPAAGPSSVGARSRPCRPIGAAPGGRAQEPQLGTGLCDARAGRADAEEQQRRRDDRAAAAGDRSRDQPAVSAAAVGGRQRRRLQRPELRADAAERRRERGRHQRRILHQHELLRDQRAGVVDELEVYGAALARADDEQVALGGAHAAARIARAAVGDDRLVELELELLLRDARSLDGAGVDDGGVGGHEQKETQHTWPTFDQP
jgi:hypothetical protein